MTLNYMVYQYDGCRNAGVMTDMAGKNLVIGCDKAVEQGNLISRRMRGFLLDLRGKNLQVM